MLVPLVHEKADVQAVHDNSFLFTMVVLEHKYFFSNLIIPNRIGTG